MNFTFNEDTIGARFKTFKLALDLLYERKGATIVETGCIRWKDDMQSGGSTYLFAYAARQYNLEFDSIDYSTASIQAARETLGDLAGYVTFHNWDSVETLKDWKGRIDLLYLDSLGCSAEPEKAQQHQLEEIQAAYDKLTDTSIVLLDDNQAANGGKTVLSKKFLLEKGWKILLDETQCLLVKEEKTV